MLLYVHRRLYVIGGILFIAVWYFLAFLYSLICTSIFISGTLGYLYWRTRKEVSYQLGLVRTRRKARQSLTESHNQTPVFETNHINSFNECCNNSCIALESKLSYTRQRNVQTAAGPLLINNFAKAKGVLFEDASKEKYRFNSSRFKISAMSNTERMTVTAKRRYPVSQEKYSLIGQLPIIQLKKEPLPFLKNFNTTMVHNPVTVKIAPPEDHKRPNSRWKFIYPSEKSKTGNDPCDARNVIAALKENRKRTAKDKDDDIVESVNSKRQRHDSSSSSGSAFMPTNSSPSVGNVESSSLLNIQKCPNNPTTSLSSTSRNKRSRNNAIASSYSSSKRLREKLDGSLIQHLAKRKATMMDTSTPVKFIKVSERNEDVSEQKTQDVETSESDQCVESDKTVEEVHETSSSASGTSSLKTGVSHRRNLSVYTSLGMPIQAAPMPAHLPTLEEHEKDKKIEARRLEWLLSAVNEAFQNKNGAMTTNEYITSTTVPAASSMKTTFPSVNSDNSLSKTLPICVSDTSSADLFGKVANPCSLTSFGPSTTSITTAPAVIQVPFLSSQTSNAVTCNEAAASATKSLFSSANSLFGSQNEKVTSVDSIFSAFSSTSSNSPVSLPQASLSSSTITTTSISLPLSSSSVVKPSSENYSNSFPSSVAESVPSSKEIGESNVGTTDSSISSGFVSSPVATTAPLTEQATILGGGFTFTLQPSSNFSFPNTGSKLTGESSGSNFPFSATSNVTEPNVVAAMTTTVTSPSLSTAVTSSNNTFHVTTSLAMIPSNRLVTAVSSTTNTATTTSQSLFPSGTSTKPFIFGSTNEQRQSLFGAAVQPQTELTTTRNEKTAFETFNSQVPLVPPSLVTVTSSNQAANNSFLSPSAMISPNQNANIFGTGGQNAFASSLTNPFGTNSQSAGFGQSQTLFANANTAVTQNQAPSFGSNQGTFVSGSTSQSAFMTSGQMQPVLGTTNAFNAPTNMQTTFGTATSSTPFQFGTNTGNFNFNFVAPSYGPLPSFGTPTPTPTASTLFSIGSGKVDRKASSSRRRLAKK